MRFKPVHENYNIRDLTASIEFYGKALIFLCSNAELCCGGGGGIRKERQKGVTE